jgi:hypothetical protein
MPSPSSAIIASRPFWTARSTSSRNSPTLGAPITPGLANESMETTPITASVALNARASAAAAWAAARASSVPL